MESGVLEWSVLSFWSVFFGVNAKSFKVNARPLSDFGDFRDHNVSLNSADINQLTSINQKTNGPIRSNDHVNAHLRYYGFREDDF